MSGGYDLHTHTECSDGTTTVEHNVAAAIDLGLEGLGVTDHDTTEPFERAYAAAAGSRLEIVPGTEFSAELDGASVHVLGYWIDPTDAALQTEMERLRNERERRAQDIVTRFHALDVPVSMGRIRELAAGAPIGRPHIAKAVVETGAADTIEAVFETWLYDGGPAYVPKHAVSPERAVELIRGAGGVAVVAHPGLFGARSPAGTQGREPGLPDEVVERMAAAGMAGIEADHPDHDAEMRQRYRRLATGLGLVVTAGSDYHGERKELQLGEATTERAAVEQLRERR